MSIPCGEAISRRRKDDNRVGIASRGTVQRWWRCSSRVAHRVVPHRWGVRDGWNPSGSAVDAGRDAAARMLRAERAAADGVVDVPQALHGSPSALPLLRNALLDLTTLVPATA